MSQSPEKTPNPLTVQPNTLTHVTEFTRGPVTVQHKVSHWRPHQGPEDVSLPSADRSPLNPLPFQQGASSKKKPSSSSEPEGKRRFNWRSSDQEGLSNEEQLETKQWFGRGGAAEQDHWPGVSVAAETHERKLKKELQKLSVQNWPCRDRLAVYSDVFGDVCESSPAFGRILGEIKTDYDLYVNHMMASYSPSHDKLLNPSLKDHCDAKTREMELEAAEMEVSRLEQEAREALQENKRVRDELQNVPAITGPEDRDTKIKRFQLLNMWREIQQLEKEMKEELVSTVTTSDTEEHTKHIKREVMGLIASNDTLRTTNKDLENRINTALDREKASESVRRRLWDEIQCDLQAESK